MGRYGLATRVSMVVVGAVWAAVGAGWLLRCGPASGFEDEILALPGSLLACGLLLVWTGLTPDRRKTLEEEVPDAHPDLDDD